MLDANILEQMSEYYEKRADLHDSLMGYTSEAKTEKLMAPILRRCEDYIAQRDVLEVACGTGNWTQLLAKRARTVVATDINESLLEKARCKNYPCDKVVFRTADAYKLGQLRGRFGAAFAADWWSHIPKSKVPGFLKGLHRKLRPGSPVIFVDMLPNKYLHRMFSHYDDEGNLIHRRNVPGGGDYYVIKNFPTEQELRQVLTGIADDVRYREHLALQRWILTYRTKSRQKTA
ncbi:MAG: methyltransferase domain-containing protein [Candidatus Zixiibacteriota bacterium]|nr:MAG: methyltransferase domain-containing protein [candidate division Zixibacteria bacterium]